MPLTKLAALKEDVKLYDHQERAVNKPGNGMIYAHSVGSGKTLTGIARFEKMKEQGKARKALVVVPSGLRRNFGDSGVKKFTDSSYNVVGTKQEQQQKELGDLDSSKDYNIISYELFRQDPEGILERSGADTLIADEFHRIKNEGTSTTKAFQNVKGKVDNVIGLTGSVVSNSMNDIQPLVDVAARGDHNLGDSKKDFETTYVKRDNSRKYQSVPEKRRPVSGFRKEKQLRGELDRYVDYIDFDDVKETANMPDKNIQEQKIPLSREQASMYRKLLRDDPAARKLVMNKRLETLKDEEASKAFSSLIESRKLMNDVSTMKPGMTLAESANESTKVRKLLDDTERHLNETNDGQVVLFSHLVNGGHDIMEAGLQERGIPYGKFLGKGNQDMTEMSRQQDVQDFNNRNKRVMLVSSAGGEGLSLNDTTYEGVLDGHYNPEKMKQMEARGVRSGGLSHRPDEEREVSINRYMSTMPKRFGILPSRYKTPDEAIYEIAKNKERQNDLLYKLMKENRKGNEV